MNQREKRFIKYGIVIPLVIAVVVTALFFVTYSVSLKSYVFKERTFSLSDYVSSDVQEAQPQSVTPDNHKIHKSELAVYDDNTIIGSAVMNDGSMPIILRGNEMNGSGRLTMTAFSKLPGEAGSVYLYCNKKDCAPVRMLAEGDVISVETYYGTFDYEMRETLLVDSDLQLSGCADAYGRSVVIYTDSSEGYGVGSGYYAVIAEQVSADIVVE